jgi:hypothetical protein
MSPSVSVWRPQRRVEMRDEVLSEMADHFEALNQLLERLGHRPFGRLELRMPGNAFDSQVIFRWERPR